MIPECSVLDDSGQITKMRVRNLKKVYCTKMKRINV